jgi:hypothetical protein
MVLWRSPFQPGQFAQFLAHPALANLRELYLADCNLSAADAARLAACERLTNLQRLWVNDGPALGEAARSPVLHRLTHVCLGGSDADAVAFADSPAAEHVRWLHLPRLSEAAAAALADSPRLGRLTTLSSIDYLSNDAAVRLAGSPHLKSLTCLRVNPSQLTARGLRALLEAEQLGWVGVSKEQARSARLARLWERRYGDGERTELIDGDWPPWRDGR